VREGCLRRSSVLYVVRSWRGLVIVLLGVLVGLTSSGAVGVIGIGGGFGLIPKDVETASTLRPRTELIHTSIVGRGGY